MRGLLCWCCLLAIVTVIQPCIAAPATAPVDDGMASAALPPAPAGWTVRELARLPGNPTRVLHDGTGRRLYVLLRDGDVYRIDLPTGAPRRVLAGASYVGATTEPIDVTGLAMDRRRRFYIVVNRKDTSQPI